ncbi:MAG: DUF4386 domain-containing protein [Acidobacteriota bacterium]|nr:DUF4386 domain-containing protein [Acidobacteriota bacterium]
MTRRTNARVAGLTFLVYIAVAFPSMVLMTRATSGAGTAAKLANIAHHVSDVRVAIVLDLISCFCALVLAVTLYGITRDQDPDLAMLVLVFRAAEGAVGAVSIERTLGQLWLATATGPGAPDPAAAGALAAVLVKLPSWSVPVAASFFAAGSLIFSYLLLRGRIVPAALAWLGVIASILVVVLLPLQLAGVVSGPITEYMWFPMLVFEVPLGFWLLIKGAAMPARRQAA